MVYACYGIMMQSTQTCSQVLIVRVQVQVQVIASQVQVQVRDSMSPPVFFGNFKKKFNCTFNIILVLLMGQELKIRHCVLKIKVNTNLIVRTGPSKAYIILQLKFYHHSGSSNSESQFQVLTLQVQVQVQVQVLKKSDSSPT